MRTRAAYVSMTLLFFIGVFLIAIASAFPEFYLSAFLRDLGMVFGPIGLVGLLYELLLRRSFIRMVRDLGPGFGKNQLIDLAERQTPQILQMLASARKEIILMGGNLRLLAFYPEKLVDIFARARNVRILIMNGDHPAARMREAQICRDGSWDYASLYRESKRAIKGIIGKLGESGRKVHAREYDLPAMHFLCIIDRRKMIVNNYSFGKTGIESPHLYFFDCDSDPISSGMMESYLHAFEYVWQEARPLESEAENRERPSVTN